jgi:Tfp pilus assembly protein PilF
MANLAYLKTQLRQYDLADQYYRQALSLLPENVQIHLNYGALLMLQYRFDEAEKHYRQALQIAPASAAAWSNLGVLLASTQREAEAEECYRNALLCDPAYQKASFNLSYILLKQGRYEEGWQRLEARAQDAVLNAYFHFPRWQGEALSGKRILIAYEGGFGDMMQFCRYASLLKAAGAPVSVWFATHR